MPLPWNHPQPYCYESDKSLTSVSGRVDLTQERPTQGQRRDEISVETAVRRRITRGCRARSFKRSGAASAYWLGHVGMLQRCCDHSGVKLSDLSLKQIDHLERAARQELERRVRRWSPFTARQLLTLPLRRPATRSTMCFPNSPPNPRVPAQARTDAMREGELTRLGTAPYAPLTKTAEFALDRSLQLVRALAAHDPNAVGLSQAVSVVRLSMGLQGNWPTFHAAGGTTQPTAFLRQRPLRVDVGGLG